MTEVSSMYYTINSEYTNYLAAIAGILTAGSGTITTHFTTKDINSIKSGKDPKKYYDKYSTLNY